ncbi:hypothetical protein [Brevundimonas sp. R86498]|uniref:hypothetical protein n=1 Tax=Brevundimonas sp. R86498 TaxID=3093845 RepID=UPI0037CC17B0
MAVAIACAVGAASCAATPRSISGGPDFALSPELSNRARVRNISMTTATLYNMPLNGFGEDLREALNRCAAGDRDLDLRAHVEQPDRSHLVTTFELTDPGDSDRVVGRYRIEVDEIAPLVLYAGAPNRSDVAARTGQLLCAQVFGSPGETWSPPPSPR